MKFAKALVLWLLALPAASFGAEADSCPTGSFAIAGSSTVLPVAELWAKGFMEKCTGVSITAVSQPPSFSCRHGAYNLTNDYSLTRFAGRRRK